MAEDRLAYNRGFTDFLFCCTEFSSKTNNCSTWFSVKSPPLEFPPIRSACAQFLAENQATDNQGFTDFLFQNTEIMTIFRENKP